MPRKRRSSSGKLSNRRIFVYLTDEERETLRDYAGTLSLSEYLLLAGLKTYKRPPVPRINREMLMAMTRIGNNMNQLAKKANAALKLGLPVNFDISVLSELREELRRLAYEIADIHPRVDD